MDFSINTLNEKEIKISQTKLYICNENNTKFIYESLHSMKINGIAKAINGRVIEVLNVKIKDKKYFHEVKLASGIVGWVSLENSPRVYRIPKYTGKIIRNNFFQFNDEQNKDHSDFINKLVDARYFFEYQDENYILVNRLGKKDHLVPVKAKNFHRYIIPEKGTTFKLFTGTQLFKYSTFDEAAIKLEEDSTAELLGYYEGLRELKVKLDEKIYWIKDKYETEASHDSTMTASPEMIDKIIYLRSLATLQKQEIEAQDKKIRIIRDSIEINNDLQRLYLTKYLGDANDFE